MSSIVWPASTFHKSIADASGRLTGMERLNREIKRRANVVQIFPNEEACERLIGALCMEWSEE
ncbi:MAG: hypothetical protein F4X51_19125 [Gemmatimonadetes bacterium]|nr:hypothetical protein [Gemmatimonadota bacterium]